MEGWGGSRRTEEWHIDHGTDGVLEAAAADDSRLKKLNAKLTTAEPQ